ncbi:MAG: AmmeMemoRadiSam system protein A [Candidatus Hydrogenedentes bacterium]|nr:AmmeMemoRadiSam system protein A [Candidatus Hydrogenedentota bacterium]
MSPETPPYLNPTDEDMLLAIARKSLLRYLESQERLDIESFPLPDRLREPMGAFVTLHGPAGLRGCIGSTMAEHPLAESVRNSAINAGTRDPRFDPVRLEELPTLKIEISALLPGDTPTSPFILLSSIDAILLGRDGLCLRHELSGRSGLLLPQVPLEHNMDRDQFLDALCRKAGAPPNAWKLPGYRLYRFTAQVFGEK